MSEAGPLSFSIMIGAAQRRGRVSIKCYGVVGGRFQSIKTMTMELEPALAPPEDAQEFLELLLHGLYTCVYCS